MTAANPTPRRVERDARAAWIRTAYARVILDSAEPAERDVVRQALEELGCSVGAPGALLTLVPDLEGSP